MILCVCDHNAAFGGKTHDTECLSSAELDHGGGHVCVRAVSFCHFRGGFSTFFEANFKIFPPGWRRLRRPEGKVSRGGSPFTEKKIFEISFKTVRNFTFFGTSLCQVAPQYVSTKSALKWSLRSSGALN